MPNLATRIANTLYEDYIENGAVPAGAAMPTMRDLQTLYGVSLTTVAHALGQLEARGLIEKRHGLGTFVTGTHRDGDHRKKAITLGVVIPSPSESELMARLYDGVQRAALASDCHVVHAPRTQEPGSEEQQVHRLIEAGCDAIVVNPSPRPFANLDEDYLLNDFQGFPIVLVDLGLPEHGRMQVVFDNLSAGHDMAQGLIRRGHRHIAFAYYRSQGRVMAWRSIDERQRGYLKALRGAGIDPRPQDHLVLDFPGAWFEEDGRPGQCILSAVEHLRGQKDPATAVIAFNDVCAVALLEAARLMGGLPDTFTVAGFDNRAIGSVYRPPFPTTNPDFILAGEKAVDLALRRLAGEVHEPSTLILPVPILWRNGQNHL